MNDEKMNACDFYECDLHTHTKRSDGYDSYEELIDHAVRRGLKVIAITDHDVIPQTELMAEGRRISLKAFGQQKGIRIIPGIEFSCNTEVEDVHVLGLNCDFSHPGFQAEQDRTRQSKITGYKMLCDKLTQIGMSLTLEKVLAAQPAVTNAAEIQKKHIFEYMAKKGYAKDWSEAKQLVKRDGRLQVKRPKPEAQDMIRLIKESGGVAVLAHPYLIEEPVLWKSGMLSREQYIDILIEAGLDGIEGAYTYHKTSYSGTMRPEEIERQIRDRYVGRLAFISGGSDYHNDAAKGMPTEKCRRLGEKGISFADFLSSPLGSMVK